MGKNQSESTNNDGVSSDAPKKRHQWVSGSHGSYRYTAKVYDKCSQDSIDSGRVNEIHIWRRERPIVYDHTIVVASYDRSWIIKPGSTKDCNAFVEILSMLQQSPPETPDEAS